ncbi:MAG: dephospho-CoA kinase [Clostridiales bacterium]|nr:dephospho-CoA kinase [Clostridiales bacterium]
MTHTDMIFIGITGGVGAGKSEILAHLAEMDGAKVVLADEIAHELMEPGKGCYEKIIAEFPGDDILKNPADKESGFDNKKLAEAIFSDERKREKINGIVHPAVKEHIKNEAKRAREGGDIKLLVLEAALLIEEKYDEICDEIWYIYADAGIRRQRLKSSRGYSDEKIDGIFASQLTDEEYIKACDVTIDNNGAIEETLKQIDKCIEERIR